MPITKIAKRVAKKSVAPIVKIDAAAFLEPGDPDTMIRFREPKSQDLFANPARRNKLKLANPAFSDQLIAQILILSSCYIVEQNEEAGVNLDDLMASIAGNERDMFLFMVSKFNEAFPMVSGEKVTDSGNDFPQTNSPGDSSASST